MTSTLKTYDNKDSKVGFIISFSTERDGAVFTVFEGNKGVTVDLTAKDVKALLDVAHEAYYANPNNL